MSTAPLRSPGAPIESESDQATRPPGLERTHRGDPSASANTPLLRRLGLIGMDPIEPVVIAALATVGPLLLIGPHGTAKSLLLCRLCEALGLVWRHYNASLLNFDDLVGYPLPSEQGGLRFVQTPASIWDAQAVFLDEISRCRPDMQNRLFSIIHEKKVQGLPIESLVYRWAAMNPPVVDDAADTDLGAYIGSERLDAALADRFNFVVEVPRWQSLSTADREAIICSEDARVSEDAATAVRERVVAVQGEIAAVDSALGPAVAEYVRLVSDQVAEMGLVLSGRRASMLYRNVIAVHAARLIDEPAADVSDSAWLALENSLPHRAEGLKIDRRRVLLAHNNAWKAVTLERTDPRRMLVGERDPVRRAIRAVGLQVLSPAELSAYVADGLSEVGPGGRHALAAFVVSSPAAGRLNAAVAEQAAELNSLIAVGQDVQLGIASGSPKHLAWQEIVKELAKLTPKDPETLQITNLLAGLFNRGDIAKPEDVSGVLESWFAVHGLCYGPKARRRQAA